MYYVYTYSVHVKCDLIKTDVFIELSTIKYYVRTRIQFTRGVYL